MQLSLSRLIISFGLALVLGVPPAQAQVSNAQIASLVEALRQAAPQTEMENDGLYSEWQVKPENIPRWSRTCIDRELSPTEFEASPVTARAIVTCVMRDILQDEYHTSGNNEALAVRRAAAWWMRGDPSEYDSPEIAPYVQRVLSAYQQQRSSTAALAPTPPQPQISDYDRYMQAGYAATQQRDYETALLYFKRALDERPNNAYAEQAIHNVENYRVASPEERPLEDAPGDRPPQPTPQ